MRKNNPVIYIVTLCLALMMSIVNAAGVYKWVDRTGKVHYSENPPHQGDASKLAAPAPSSDNEPPLPQGESIRGPDGRCLTVKCMADEMEADRLQNEQVYARQRAENERYMQKQTDSQQPSSSASSDGYRQYWRTRVNMANAGPAPEAVVT